MFVSNPFTLLSEIIPPFFMQAYVVLMIFAVAFGTLFDLYHKRSAEFFFLRRQKSKAAAQRRLQPWEIASLAIRTIGTEVATAGEFCKWPRRLSHLADDVRLPAAHDLRRRHGVRVSGSR